MVQKLPLEKIGDGLADNNFVLLLGLGFDQRCLEILKNIPKEKRFDVIGILNSGWNNLSSNNISSFQKIAGANALVLGNGAKDIISLSDIVFSKIAQLTKQTDKKLLIDITAMSHELLVVLLGGLHTLQALERVTLLYVGARKYSFNETDDKVWLSSGVNVIRSILGFPGEMLPSRKLHLILLAGFEVERATETITRYEPASLSIGRGSKEQSISEQHYNHNVHFVERLNKFISEQDIYADKIHDFEFSCVDPLQTKKNLIEHIKKIKSTYEERNIVICPLNTKISTVGVVLTAFEYPEIQICYAEPVEYNIEGYATAGDNVTIIPFSELIY